jgi:hypothetical protein
MAGIVAKKHIRAGTLILAVCDENLIGKEFESKDMLLNLASDFYKGTHITDEELTTVLRAAQSVHVVGEKSMAFAKILFPDIEPITIGETVFATVFKM